MPRFVSTQQRIANRKNARKSTGPVTPEGKRKSSRNAIKHGLLAREVVVSGPTYAENQADFDTLLADLVDEIQPRGFVEQSLVERIATCYWRLRRVQRFENGAIRQTIETLDPDESSAASNLHYFEDSLIHQLERLADIDRLIELAATPLETHTPEQRQEVTLLLNKVPYSYPRPLFNSQPPPDPIQTLADLPNTRAALSREIESTRSHIDAEKQEKENIEVRRPLMRSLPADADLLKLIRYETMLDRQIHRALAELRRLRRLRPKEES